MGIELTRVQLSAIKKVKDWYTDRDKQVFIIHGFAGCLDEETLILTDSGTIPLKSIIMENGSMDFKGFQDYKGSLRVYNGRKFTDIAKIYATDIMDGYDFGLSNGVSLKASEIHPLLTIRDGKYCWVQAKDIMVGDFVATLGNKNIYSDESLELDLDSYYKGYYIADGYVYGRCVSFTSKDRKRLELLQKYLEDDLGHTGSSSIRAVGKSYYTYGVNNDKFLNLIEPIGYDVKNKIIDISNYSTPSSKYSLLLGLMNDISIGKKEISFCNKHKDNVIMYKILMQEFGIMFGDIRYRDAGDGAYETRLLSCSLNNFYNTFGNLVGSKNSNDVESLVLSYQSRKSNTNVNVVPNMSLKFSNFDNTGKKFHPTSLHDYRYGKKNASYDVVDKLFDYTGDSDLGEILQDRYFWCEVVRKDSITQKFYDLNVPDGNSFVSNSIISHNTGKSTIIEAMIDELEIRSNTKFCTFTGKASLVLNQKGCPATTLHRLMYDLVEYTEDGKSKFRFEKKSFLDEDIKLIVVDEVSMVSKTLMDDLLSYDKPVIAIGDPMQLPPIGEDNGFMSHCDVFLSEIHRQAQGNPIIHLSMLARTGQQIPYGTYGNNVVVVPKSRLTNDLYLRADQVICGKNATRKNINNIVRRELGFDSDLPVKGDKIICLRNNWKEVLEGYPLINGMVGHVKDIRHIDRKAKTSIVDFKPEFLDSRFRDLSMDLNEFVGEKQVYDPNAFGKFIKANSFDYGYAITCHKSQGSSFGKVLLLEEVLNPANHDKWLYTGITRASDKLILCR